MTASKPMTRSNQTVRDQARVLIVDDRPDNLLALQAVLEPLDLDVIAAASGTEALHHLLLAEVSVIVLDVQMPVVDGFETATLIKSREATRHIPIIFLTAISGEIEHHLHGYAVGAVDYLSKPFAPELLRAKVKVFVDLWQQSKLIEEQRSTLAARLAELDRVNMALSRQRLDLARSNAALENFAGSTCQDLLEPLHNVAGFLELLAGGSMADNEELQVLERTRELVDAMRSRIESMLEYARVSSAPFYLVEFDLGALIDEVVVESRDVLEQAGAGVVHESLPTVRGDRDALHEVFRNLIMNAGIHGIRRPLTIELSAEQTIDWTTIRVKDDGVGIRPADTASIFTLSGHASVPRGIGLVNARRVLERHGGDLWHEAPPSDGTVMALRIPR